MNRDRTLIGGLALLGIGIIVIGAIWYFVLRSPEEASAPIESVPLELPTDEPTAVPEPTDEPEPTEAPTEEPTEAAAELVEEATEAPTEAPTEVPTEEPTEEPAAEGAGLVLYEISQEGSEVRFIINEDLRGQPTTVIGVSDQVAGQIAADNSDLSSAQVGVITINARTFATDNDFRNNAIQNRILNTGEFEFITFTPTAVNGLPENVEVGETITFEIVGDLTIRDITNEVTFSVTATATAAGQLTGSASTEILRADYNLIIPSVPNVANVTEEVQLEIDFVANAVEQ